MVAVQDWKTTKFAKTNDTDHIRAIEALASLLEGNTPPTSTAQSIATAYEASLKETKGCFDRNLWCENKLSVFWESYMSDAIACFGSTEEQARLTSLLLEISKLPDLKDDDGNVVKSIHNQTFWFDLPGWGCHFPSAAFMRVQEFSQEEMDDYLAQIPRLANATRFAAKLLQEGIFVSDLPHEASCQLKGGLEYPYNNDSYSGLEPEESIILIPAATTWLLFAGETIYEHCSGGDTSNGWARGTWNLQRWEFWKSQLMSFVERKDFNEECRGLAEQTAKKMLEIEKNFQG